MGTKDVPEVPELEFLLYYSALAEHWAKANELSIISDEDCVKDIMHIGKGNLDVGEVEFHEVVGKPHPDYVNEQWTFDQCATIYLGGGISMATMAARHWMAWRKRQGDKDDIKPFSTDAMIEELDEFTNWAVELWNPEGGHKI